MVTRTSFSVAEFVALQPSPQREEFLQRWRKLNSFAKNKYQVDIRDDSKLVWYHLCDPQCFPQEYVARELWFMKLLYQYTRYPQISRDCIPIIRASLSYLPDLYNHIQMFVIPCLQFDCMLDAITKTFRLPDDNSVSASH